VTANVATTSDKIPTIPCKSWMTGISFPEPGYIFIRHLLRNEMWEEIC